MKKLLPLFVALFASSMAFAQLTLGPSPYNQDFNSIGTTGLPAGFSVRTGSTATALGTAQAFGTAAVAWNNTSGAFKNFASATDLTSAATATQQSSATNRSLGVRQTGSFGDAGAAFVLQLANTVDLANFDLTFKLQSLDITSPRTTTWRVDYGFGTSPSSFTTASTGTLTTGGATFTNNTVTVDFGNALDNQSGNIWIRVVTVNPSTGSGNRASSAIDDLSLTYSSATPTPVPTLFLSPANINFGNVGVGNSSSIPYRVYYSNLNGSDVTVSTIAPFSIAKSGAGPFVTSVTYTSSELVGESTDLYARFSPTSVGPAIGTISHTGGGVSVPVNLALTATGTSVLPVAVDDNFSGLYGNVISGNVSTNDSDPQGFALTFSKLTDPQSGILTFNADGTFSYQSVNGSAATQTFTYRVTNGLNLTADATVTITLAEQTKVFISQYYEGASVNKWIELTNPTSSPVNTASLGLKLALYNISGDAGNIVITGTPSQVVNLNVNIPAKSSVLIGNSGNGNEVPYLTAASANQTSNSVINFNGNDGIALLDAGNNIIDAFGTGINAKDDSYVRKPEAIVPSPVFNLADWTLTPLAAVQDATELDDPVRLGVHVQADLPECVSPTAQPSSLTFSAVGTKTLTLNFTASADAGEYLIVRSLNNSLTAVPVDGTVYNAGNSLGGGVVVARTNATSFTDTNLPSGTTIFYFIYALRSTACTGGPKYLTIAPLSGSQSTVPLPVCSAPVNQPTNLQIGFSTYNSIQGTFTPAIGADEFLVVMSTDSTWSTLPVNQTTYSIGDTIGGGTVIKKGAQGSFIANGLNQNTNYFFYIFSVNSNCNGGPLYLTTAPLTGRQRTKILDTNTLNFYFGNLHAHSSYSDGNADDRSKKPEDNYAFAKNSRAMDFLGISEHNHTQAGMRLANWAPGLAAAKNATTSDFVALYGMEWGVISGGGHVLVYGVDSLVGWEPGEHQIYVPKSTYTGNNGLFKVINRHGQNAFATLAHPNGGDFNNIEGAYDASADLAIVGSALVSGPAFSTNVTYSNPASVLAKYYNYYNKLLSKGYRIGATIDHDNHNMTFGRHTRARLVVLAPALTESDLLDAMRKMRFYASEDSAARVSFTINQQPIGSEFTGNGAPQISVTGSTTSPIATISIIRGTPGSGIIPPPLVSSATTSLTYSDEALTHLSTGYYYADITEADGSRIITSPIWYTRNDSLRSEQVITFNAIPAKTYGDADFSLSATSTNASIPVTYASSDTTIARVVGNVVQIRQAGVVNITAAQTGNALYKPAISKTQLLSIAPRAIVASIDAKTKEYGAADPALTFTFTPALVGSDVFTGSLIREVGEGVGSYFITQGTLALDSNYTLTVDSALFTITPKAIFAAIDAKEKVYGDADPELTYTLTPALIAGDSITGSLTRAIGESVGTYAITQGTLALDSNYSLSVDSAVFTITPKAVFAAVDAKVKVYGDADPELTYTFIPALIAGDSATGTLIRAAGEDVGTYLITQGTLALNSNYTLTVEDTVALTIIKKAVVVTADPKEKVYGTPDPILTFTSSPPLVAGDTITGALTRSPGEDAGVYTILQGSLALSDNYTLNYDSALFVINKATATITLSNLSQTFDGTPKSVTVATTPVGLDSIAVTYNGSINAPVAAGSYAVVATLSNNNYDAAPATATLTITQPLNLKVQYRNADASLTNNEGKPHLRIVNTGTTAVPYSQLTARYWITPENFRGALGMWIDYAQLGNSKVIMRYVPLNDPRLNALGYIEYSFTTSAGLLAAGSNSGDIQSRYANTDWSLLNEANDYSIGTNSSYADKNTITLYRNGVLVWGTEPQAEVAVVKLKVLSESKSPASTNSISTYLNMKNEGNVAVNYNDISVRYWFTSEGTSPLKFWLDYAAIGNSAVSGSFVALNPAAATANNYLELKVRPAASTFYPLSSTGNIQYRISKTDWSNFNQLDDHSYKTGAMAENSKITVYYRGQLIYGTEPSSSTTARLKTSDHAPEENLYQTGVESSASVIYPNPTSGNFTVEMNDERTGPFEITILNTSGRSVNVFAGHKTESHFSKEYDIQLPTGLYYLRIGFGKQMEYRKIVVK